MKCWYIALREYGHVSSSEMTLEQDVGIATQCFDSLLHIATLTAKCIWTLTYERKYINATALDNKISYQVVFNLTKGCTTVHSGCQMSAEHVYAYACDSY